MANRKALSKLQLNGGLNLPAETAERVLITDANGDAKSSSVSTTTLSYLDATSSIQTQLDSKASEADVTAAQEDIDDLVTLSGVPVNSVNLGTFSGSIIPDDQTIKQAIQALETEIDSLPSPFFYAGTYNPSTNTPDLDLVGARISGATYYVTADGTHDFGAFGGSITFDQGDKVVFNGTTWDKWDNTDAVPSVFGRTGAVTAQSGDYSANQISNTPAGTISSTDVQGALNELDTDVQAAQTDATQALSDAATVQSNLDTHITKDLDAHDASAISVIPSGNLSSMNVQAALEELQSDINNFDPASPGDISETSFSGANNQSTLANVTGFAFANATVRSFSAIVSVYVNATTPLYEAFDIQGIQKGSEWDISIMGTGDDSQVNFDITSAGQIQYTSGDYLGFTSLTIKFRAITTSV